VQTVASLSVSKLRLDVAHDWRSCTPTMTPLASDLLPFPGQMRREDHLKSASLPDRLSSSGRAIIVDYFSEVSSRTSGSARKSHFVWHSSHRMRGSNQRDAAGMRSTGTCSRRCNDASSPIPRQVCSSPGAVCGEGAAALAPARPRPFCRLFLSF